MMLFAALEFKDVFPRNQERDPSFVYVPSLEDWVKVETVCQFLAIFNEVTKMSSLNILLLICSLQRFGG